MFNLCTAKKPMKKKRNMFRQGVQIFYCLVCLYKTSEFRFNSRLARAGTPEQRPVRTGIIIETLRDRFMGSAEARRGKAGRKGSEVEPVKRNTSRYYRRRGRQKTDTFVCQLQSEITDHSCVLITNRGTLLLLLLGVGFRVFDGRIIETVMPGRQLVQLSHLRLSS